MHRSDTNELNSRVLYEIISFALEFGTPKLGSKLDLKESY
jgi:hypothetical protein